MHEEYIKEKEIFERTEEELNIELIKSIIKTKQDYLLKKAKNKGLVIDMIKEIELRRQQHNEDIQAG